MIKLENLDPEHSTPEYYLSSSLSVNGNIIPINLNTPLVNELGKNLLKAAADGDIEEIRRLLTKGAPFTADWLGTSPLHLAAQGNHKAICELLLSAGISPNARTKVDRTPLHMAACEGHMDIVKLLLEADADVDCTDLLGMTPLHWAVQNGHADIVYLLLKSNAQVDVANKFSLKPVDVAAQIGRPDITRVLEEQCEIQQHEDPTAAAENLAIELAAQDEDLNSPLTKENVQMYSPSDFESEDILVDHEEDTGDASDHNIELDVSDPQQTENSVSMKILQEHGITMLPNDDDNNILSTVMETGHSVVLTDVGKQMLDCVKASEEAAETATRNTLKTNNNYITLTADELLMMASNASISKNQTQIIQKINGKYVPKTIKKIVMTKNKLQRISPLPNPILRQKTTIQSTQTTSSASSERPTPLLPSNRSQVAVLTKQLEDANRTIEEYKVKLLQKEAEAEQYKHQLQLLRYS